MLRTLLVLTVLLFSLPHVIAQYEIFKNLTTSESFIAHRVQQPVFNLPFGVALGEVDSIQVVSGEFQDSTRNTYPFVYSGSEVTFTSTEGDTAVGFFFQSDFTVPIVPSQNGADSFQRRIIVAFDFFGELFIDTTYDRGVMEYSNGLLVGTTTITSYQGDDEFERSVEFIVENGKVISEIGTDKDLLAGVKQVVYRAYTSYDSLTSAVLSHDIYSDIEPFEGDTSLLDTISYDAIVNTSDELNLSIDYHDDEDFMTSLAFRNESGEFVSGKAVETRDAEPPATIDFYRTDNGADPFVRSYIILNEEGYFEKSTYYYRQAVSESRELPVLGATLKGANPISPGSEIRLEGLTSAGRVEIFDLQGRAIGSWSNYQNGHSIVWPQTHAGMYYVTCHVAGYAPRAWPIISQ